MQNRTPAKMGDLLVGVALVLFLGTVGLSGIGNARSIAAKAKCISNLHQIGLAILLYQNDNGQSYPRAVMDATGNPKPTWGSPYQADKDLGPVSNVNAFASGKTAPAPNDVTAALYLLMVNEQIVSTAFVCPDADQKPWDFGGGAHNALDWTNWQGNDGLAAHLSYSYQNVYSSTAAVAAGFQIRNPDASFAVASDMNPGGEAVTSVKIDSSQEQLQAANSFNHGQLGQNVLFGDGHAEWETSPFCGSQHDNIFTAAGDEITGADETGRKKVVIIASPVSATDSILLPTAADIGYKPSGSNPTTKP